MGVIDLDPSSSEYGWLVGQTDLPRSDSELNHFAMAHGETIVQVHGHSPLPFNYVNPGDDASKSK